jgi:hypothetical protein
MYAIYLIIFWLFVAGRTAASAVITFPTSLRLIDRTPVNYMQGKTSTPLSHRLTVNSLSLSLSLCLSFSWWGFFLLVFTMKQISSCSTVIFSDRDITAIHSKTSTTPAHYIIVPSIPTLQNYITLHYCIKILYSEILMTQAHFKRRWQKRDMYHTCM